MRANRILPVDIILAPEWWNKHTGITFDRDFFFHPLKRVECEQKMEETLYERWGKYGLGEDKDTLRPEIGAVHLAAGFLLSEILGCEVEYNENHPPAVKCNNREELRVDVEGAFKTKAFKDFEALCNTLKVKHGYLTGDVNWGGLLNIVLDIRGQQIFLDMAMEDENVQVLFDDIFSVISKFVNFVERETSTTSISVNRVARYYENPLLLHSQCSHTMISTEDYERYLMKFDIAWAKNNHPYGIHYCGNDPHRYAESFAKLPSLDFLDVGWGGDLKILREHLPNTFLNIRLDPVTLNDYSEKELESTIVRLVSESGNPGLTGVCCINMDDEVEDSKITTIFQTVANLRQSYQTGN